MEDIYLSAKDELWHFVQVLQVVLLEEFGGVVGMSYVWQLEVAHPAGLEPATNGLEIRCSIQLSYGCFVHVSEHILKR
jgi:hypothetical protein